MLGGAWEWKYKKIGSACQYNENSKNNTSEIMLIVVLCHETWYSRVLGPRQLQAMVGCQHGVTGHSM